MKRGISLINNKIMVGPRIEPYGTPDFIYVNAERPFPWTTACCLSLRYDVNQARVLLSSFTHLRHLLNETQLILFKSTLEISGKSQISTCTYRKNSL